MLLFLSFPKYGHGIVAWIAFVPLLFALKQGSVKSALLTGLSAGLTFNIGLVYWATSAIVNYGHLPLPVGLAAMLLLAAYLGIYVALFCGGVAYLKERGVPQAASAPLLWTSLEFIKSYIFTGFPWENLAYSQYLYRPIIQVADLTGTYGVTFIIVLINIVIYDILSDTIAADRKSSPKRLAMEAGGAFLLLFILLIYGNLRINEIEREMKRSPALDIALIQGNIDQSSKWNPEYQQETLASYKSLSEHLPIAGSGLVVWPETAVPFYFQERDLKSIQIYQTAKKTGHWFLFGSPSYHKEGGGVSFYNSAFLVSPAGEIAGRYDKVHLVPYGEYVPWRKFFPFLGKLVEGAGDFSTGDGYYPLTMNNRKIGILICYEAIFPEASRAYKRSGAELLVNITNDAWFGLTSAPYQHLSMMPFRAVENRLYVVRAANTGISAVIDPTGRIESGTDLFVEAALAGQVRFVDSGTYYMAYGDSFAYLCLISLVLIFMKLNFPRRIT